METATKEYPITPPQSVCFSGVLGLAGFIAVHSFGRSLSRHLDRNLKEILRGDLVLSAPNPLTPGELMLADQIMGGNKAHARLVRFYTMVRAGDNARLVQVMAVDGSYPLYGGFSLEGGSRSSKLQSSPCVFLTRDTAHALGLDLSLKSPLVLGTKTFYIQDFFTGDPDKSLTAVELAPKIYMGITQLEGTGLIRFGSRIRYLYHYRFPDGTDLTGLAGKLEQRFAEGSGGHPRINVYDSRDVNQRLGKITGYFTGYMGLVSIVALFLAGIATAYLFRGYLNLKQREMAVLMSVGATHQKIYLLFSGQLLLLGTLAAGLATVLSLFLLPAFPPIFQGLIPSDIKLSTDTATLVLAVGMGMAGSLLSCLPVFVRIFRVKPLILLRGQGGRFSGMERRQAMSFLPGLSAFFLVSVVVAGSLKTGGLFVLGFILALGLLSGMGWLVFSGCRMLSTTPHLVGKIAFRNLYRNKWPSLSCFVTIAMGVFLVSMVPQIQQGIQTEIMRPRGLKVPVFFLVDIQEEQTRAFREFISHQHVNLVNLSPMVRGRILRVNQTPFFGEKKGADARQIRPRGRRLLHGLPPGNRSLVRPAQQL